MKLISLRVQKGRAMGDSEVEMMLSQTLPTHVSGPRALAGPRGPSGWLGGGGLRLVAT